MLLTTCIIILFLALGLVSMEPLISANFGVMPRFIYQLISEIILLVFKPISKANTNQKGREY